MDAKFRRSSLEDVSALLAQVFPNSSKFHSVDYLRWYYLDNPVGEAIWLDYVEDGVTLGHYAAIPQNYSNCGGSQRVYLSVNSAVSPALRGKGIFAQLGRSVYAQIQNQDPSAAGVIGVPNRLAAPPRVRHLNWQLLQPLDLKVSIVSSIGTTGFRSFAATASGRLTLPWGDILGGGMTSLLQQSWTSDLLSWRLRNPVQDYWITTNGDGVSAIGTTTRLKGIKVGIITKVFGREADLSKSGPKLFCALGRAMGVTVLVYGGRRLSAGFYGTSIPVQLRRSPLTFGYHLFADHKEAFEPDLMNEFEFFDFDLF